MCTNLPDLLRSFVTNASLQNLSSYLPKLSPSLPNNYREFNKNNNKCLNTITRMFVLCRLSLLEPSDYFAFNGWHRLDNDPRARRWKIYDGRGARGRIVNSRLFRQAAFPFFVRQWPHYERRKDPTASTRSGNALLRLRECQKRIWVVASRRCDPNRNISGITRLRFFPFYAGQNTDASVPMLTCVCACVRAPLSLSLSFSFLFLLLGLP